MVVSVGNEGNLFANDYSAFFGAQTAHEFRKFSKNIFWVAF